MKWIIILLLIVAGVWAYFNVDFTGAKNNAQDSAKNSLMQTNKTNKKLKILLEITSKIVKISNIFAYPPTKWRVCLYIIYINIQKQD